MKENTNNLIEDLYNKIDNLETINKEQALEIAKLNNEIQLRIKSIEKLENDIIEYQRKVKKLEEELDGNVTEAYENSEWWHNRFIGQQNANEILTNRIDKAIDYIKSEKYFDDYEVAKLFEKYDKILLEKLGDKE